MGLRIDYESVNKQAKQKLKNSSVFHVVVCFSIKDNQQSQTSSTTYNYKVIRFFSPEPEGDEGLA